MLKPAEPILGFDLWAVEQDRRNLVVVLTTAQAGLRPILQMRILRQRYDHIKHSLRKVGPTKAGQGKDTKDSQAINTKDNMQQKQGPP